ncbi:MAG TPA: cobyrinic acid a,c-diamide synthase, partial [Phycisphaerales bacterium]|nr:cobyrinic acid a,c-diamide synthase [Phycisphaerales bacterium]
VVQIARSAKPIVVRTADDPPQPKRKVRIGIAQDLAFHFYYPDNLDSLRRGGAELIPFSPISDSALPENLAGLYVGGGYPEEHAEALASNHPLLQAIRAFAASGRPIYAECGGLMYLAKRLHAVDGRAHCLAGVLPPSVRMLSRLKSLGYVEVTLARDSLWGPRGATFRGHEFHYSEIAEPTDGSLGELRWENIYLAERASSRNSQVQGFQNGNILASYVHGHFASRAESVTHFLSRCEESP